MRKGYENGDLVTSRELPQDVVVPHVLTLAVLLVDKVIVFFVDEPFRAPDVRRFLSTESCLAL